MHVCVVLNATYEPLHPIDARDGIIHVLAGRAEIIEAHPDAKFRTVSTEYPVPVTIRLNRYVKQNRKYTDGAKLNKHNLFVRDDYTCQYCGRHVSDLKDGEGINKDHVVPKDKGGRTTWDNLVTACTTCNSRKANRTPEQAGMRLRSKPERPLNAKLSHKKKKKYGHRLTIDFE